MKSLILLVFAMYIDANIKFTKLCLSQFVGGNVSHDGINTICIGRDNVFSG